MLRRLSVLVRKELCQLRRDPVLLILIAWLFTVEVLLCSYALTFDLNDAPLALEDRDGTPESRALTDLLERSPDFRIAAHATADAGLERWLERGEAVALVRIPSGWGASRRGSGHAQIQLLVDGADAGTAATVRGYLLALIRNHAGPALAGAPTRPGPEPPVESRTRVWFNAELETVYFMVLSMVALSAFMVGVIHPAASLVKEQETGTLEQLRVSPMAAGELVAAKLAVTLVVSLLGLTASLALVWWFDVPLRGSLALFYLASGVFLVSSMGLGVLVASLADNLQQVLLLAFFGLLPVMFLSGTMVPVEAMPRAVELATLASPLRHYMDCLLGIFLKGSGWELLWRHLVAMAALGAGILGAGLWRLERRLG